VAGGPWWTMGDGSHGTHRSSHRAALHGLGARREREKRMGIMSGSSPRAPTAGAAEEEDRRWHPLADKGLGAWQNEKGCGEVKRGRMVKVLCPFIGPERWWRGGEIVGWQSGD
jgi:hypothetical protein